LAYLIAKQVTEDCDGANSIKNLSYAIPCRRGKVFL